MTSAVPDLRELRLAIVMNGGVSLAVWMGGVTTEIDNLRTCHRDQETPVAKAWRQILAEARFSRVIVDTIAGTSAGGINGVMLATAIARGAALPELRQLWLEDATLKVGKLLRSAPMA